MTHCYIAYLNRAGGDEDTVVVKIGWSISPAGRYHQLCAMGWQEPSWMEYTLASDTHDGQTIERKMHEILKRYRVHHEWFHVPWHALESAKERIENTFLVEWDVVSVGIHEPET